VNVTNALSHPVKFQVLYACNGTRRIMGFPMKTKVITLAPGHSAVWTLRSPVLRLKSDSTPVSKSKLAHLSTWFNCAMTVRTPGYDQSR
jgi:hypothetical protein